LRAGSPQSPWRGLQHQDRELPLPLKPRQGRLQQQEQ
jgi:hypothetical protein